MDLSSAIRFSARQVSSELFSAGSIFSVYSLATSLALGFAALAYRRFRRRGRASLRVVSRAIFSKHFALRESVHADLKLFALSVIFMPAIVGGLVISSHTVAKGAHTVLAALFGSMSSSSLPELQIKIISTVVLFLAYEIGYFVDHYLKHRVSFLWELHKLHHTADVLTPLTNFRNHPIDNIVFGYMLAIFIGGASGFLHWLFNRPTEIFAVDGKNILFLCFLWTIGHLQHSQFWIPFSGLWGRIFLSPAHHQIHHSKDPAHFNRNLGSVLAVWDWMCGTLEMPSEKNPRLIYGVDEEGVNPHSSAGMLLTPAINSARALWRTLARVAKSFATTLETATGRLQRRHG
jgi:sterol desaturase/sphingolipid hydroxylase (fatty acid hydroxylase superfamily)